MPPNGTSDAPNSHSVRSESTSFSNLRQRASSLHQPTSRGKAKRAHNNSRQHVRNIVVPAINRRYAHAHKKWQAHPEEPATVPPRRKNCHCRAGDMSRWKRAAVHTTEPLDEFEHRGEISSVERVRIHRCERVIGTLDRKKHSDEIDHVVRDRCRNHHIPECNP